MFSWIIPIVRQSKTDLIHRRLVLSMKPWSYIWLEFGRFSTIIYIYTYIYHKWISHQYIHGCVLFLWKILIGSCEFIANILYDCCPTRMEIIMKNVGEVCAYLLECTVRQRPVIIILTRHLHFMVCLLENNILFRLHYFNVLHDNYIPAVPPFWASHYPIDS